MNRKKFISTAYMAADVVQMKKGVATWWHMDTPCGASYLLAHVCVHVCVRVCACARVCARTYAQVSLERLGIIFLDNTISLYCAYIIYTSNRLDFSHVGVFFYFYVCR